MRVNAPGQWVVHASFKLYTQSFLSLLLDNGWVSDEVSVYQLHNNIFTIVYCLN